MPRASLPLDTYDLYELCVTEPVRLCRFIAAAHGREPRTLREDFSGTAALARAWAGLNNSNRAIAVDTSAAPLRRAAAPRVRAVLADVMGCRARADVIACTNFPLGYWHSREALVTYLRHSRACLAPRGILVADTYGGRDAFTPLTITQRLRGPRGEQIEYIWAQRRADPLTGRVLDTLSFRVSGAGRTRMFKDSFVYDWRLWSIPELRDAMLEAGFRAVEVYDRLGDAVDDRGRLYLRQAEELDANWVAYAVARR